MDQVADFIAEKKARIRKDARVMCGSCKATGIEHVWNAQALLEPVSPPRPCPHCKGAGKFE